MKPLRRIRGEKRLTLQQLSELSGVHMMTISEIERGVRSRPQPVTLGKLAEALGVSVGDLLEEEGETESPKAEAPPEPAGEERRVVWEVALESELAKSAGSLTRRIEDFVSAIRRGKAAPMGWRDEELSESYWNLRYWADTLELMRPLSEVTAEEIQRLWWAKHELDELRAGYQEEGAADADLRTRRPETPAERRDEQDAAG